MKVKIYTASVVVDDFGDKNYAVADNMYCESFASEDERSRWLDETYLDIVRERDADDEGKTWVCHTHESEREIEIPCPS